MAKLKSKSKKMSILRKKSLVGSSPKSIFRFPSQIAWVTLLINFKPKIQRPLKLTGVKKLNQICYIKFSVKTIKKALIFGSKLKNNDFHSSFFHELGLEQIDLQDLIEQ
jgi:hypothetical protein